MSHPDPATVDARDRSTPDAGAELEDDRAVEIGSYFVSNYPPFGTWSEVGLEGARAVLDAPPGRPAPLGVYVHLPFCRKRCRFCYFKVYTDTPSAEIRAYVDALGVEARAWASTPVIAGRRPSFVYFGGGTPSYLSAEQLDGLFASIHAALPWAEDAEITFECEPGTVRAPKLEALRRHGVTRLSLGIESFEAGVLELNGRAHGAQHIEPAFRLAREAGFPQINVDLIAGMIGETEESWRRNIERLIALAPDSVTIYQMEVPPNTGIARSARAGEELGGRFAGWTQKRRWVDEAFRELEAHGWQLSSGYTAVRAPAGPTRSTFVYRDSLWQGADLVPLGVSAFGHVQGAHLQNDKDIDAWLARVHAGGLALQRGLMLSDAERLIRELVLQFKRGRVAPAAFAQKFGEDIRTRFAPAWARLIEGGFAVDAGETFELTRSGLLQVDRLLPSFFLVDHGGLIRWEGTR